MNLPRLWQIVADHVVVALECARLNVRDIRQRAVLNGRPESRRVVRRHLVVGGSSRDGHLWLAVKLWYLRDRGNHSRHQVLSLLVVLAHVTTQRGALVNLLVWLSVVQRGLNGC